MKEHITMTSSPETMLALAQFELWFFRDLVDEQRLKLFTILDVCPEPKTSISHTVQRSLMKEAFSRLAASRPAPVDREAVAQHLAETFPGDYSTSRSMPLVALRPNEGAYKIVDAIVEFFDGRFEKLPRATKPTTPDAVGEPAGWQRCLKYAHAPVWEQCPTSEATSHFDRSPHHEYRPLYTHPPAQPDTSADVLQERERCAAIAAGRKAMHDCYLRNPTAFQNAEVTAAREDEAAKIEAAIRRTGTE